MGSIDRNSSGMSSLLSLIPMFEAYFIQFVAITVLLVFAAHHESPTTPGLSEWRACERPLGTWDSIWLVRVASGAVLSVWGFKRDRAIRIAYVDMSYRSSLAP